MKYKIGNKVRIKSLDWYNENKDADSYVHCGDRVFDNYMSVFCGSVVTIGEVSPYGYDIRENMHCRVWTDEMIEGLAEEEDLIPKFGEYSDNEPLNVLKMTTDFIKEIGGLPCPEGYIFKDENGNVNQRNEGCLGEEEKRKELSEDL